MIGYLFLYTFFFSYTYSFYAMESDNKQKDTMQTTEEDDTSVGELFGSDLSDDESEYEHVKEHVTEGLEYYTKFVDLNNVSSELFAINHIWDSQDRYGALKLLLTRKPDLTKQNCYGQTVLNNYIEYDFKGSRYKEIKLLLEHKADPHAIPFSALHMAVHAFHASLDIMKLLVAYGADVNKQDSDGNTPAHRLICSFNEDKFKFLLESGYNVTLQNKYGDTIFHKIADYTRPFYLKVAFDYARDLRDKIETVLLIRHTDRVALNKQFPKLLLFSIFSLVHPTFKSINKQSYKEIALLINKKSENVHTCADAKLTFDRETLKLRQNEEPKKLGIIMHWKDNVSEAEKVVKLLEQIK